MITLQASCLASKFGFHDGDILDPFFFGEFFELDRRYPDVRINDHLSFEHEVLARCVERHLLPLLPGVATYRIGSIHNPIRAMDTAALDGFSNVSVDLDPREIQAIADELQVEISGAKVG